MLQAWVRVQTLLASRDRGVTTVEYGMLLIGIALVMIVGFTFYGDRIDDFFRGSSDEFCKAPAPCTP